MEGSEHNVRLRATNPTRSWLRWLGVLSAVWALCAAGLPAVRAGVQQTVQQQATCTPASSGSTLLPLHRLYATLDRHFYTTSTTECNQVLSSPPGAWLGWRYESITGYLSQYSITGNTAPVYRLYRNYHHVYTTSAAEVATLKNLGWTQETVIGFISTDSQRPDGCPVTPLYRLWKWQNDAHDHLYTISTQERDLYRNIPGWTDEGVLGFVWTGAPCPTPTNTPTNTRTNTPTNTRTNTPTNTPTPTDTPTNTPTNTPTPTDTPTNTPTNTPTPTDTPTPTNTPTITPTTTPTNTPTATPTPGVIAISGATHVALCQHTPGLVSFSGRIVLPPGNQALLQTQWAITQPADKRSGPFYQLHGLVQNDDTFTVQVVWPGIAPDDQLVQTFLGVNLLDPLTLAPLTDTLPSFSYYWYPWVCAAPTAPPAPYSGVQID